jgi:hypothetical protein
MPGSLRIALVVRLATFGAGCESLDDYMRPTEIIVENPKVIGTLHPLDVNKYIVGNTVLFKHPKNSFSRSFIIYFGANGEYDRMEITPDGMFSTPGADVLRAHYFPSGNTICFIKRDRCTEIYFDDGGNAFLNPKESPELFQILLLEKGDSRKLSLRIQKKVSSEDGFFSALNEIGRAAGPVITEMRRRDAEDERRREEMRRALCPVGKPDC